MASASWKLSVSVAATVAPPCAVFPQRSRNRVKASSGPLIRRAASVSNPVAASHLAHCAVTSFEGSSHMAYAISHSHSRACARPDPRTVLHSSRCPRAALPACATAIIDSVSKQWSLTFTRNATINGSPVLCLFGDGIWGPRCRTRSASLNPATLRRSTIRGRSPPMCAR